MRCYYLTFSNQMTEAKLAPTKPEKLYLSEHCTAEDRTALLSALYASNRVVKFIIPESQDKVSVANQVVIHKLFSESKPILSKKLMVSSDENEAKPVECTCRGLWVV